jgi:hypothetical protein
MAGRDRPQQRQHHKLGAQMVVERPAHHLAAESIEHHREIDEASSRRMSVMSATQISSDTVGCKPRIRLATTGQR